MLRSSQLLKSSYFVVLLSTLLFPLPSLAAPVEHYVHLLNSGGTPEYTGLLVIDDSRLTPNTFTPWSDPGLISFSLTIGGFTWIEDSETDLGVITDATGVLSSFHNSTTGTQVNNTTAQFGRLLRISENNGEWLTNTGFSGPSHTISIVPEPTSFALALAGLCLAMRRRR